MRQHDHADGAPGERARQPSRWRAYSVVYRDSQGLDYDGQKIHRHYNNWLNNIRISIDRELIAAPPLAQP
ncbi:MAG TPA: hypothetical protein PKY87_06200 [Terricaulis sp.]|nr:hypothetical protein [Terricaulis sp.]